MNKTEGYRMWEQSYVPKRAGFPTALENCRFPWESLSAHPEFLTLSVRELHERRTCVTVLPSAHDYLFLIS